jgi:hypothetical protein
MRQFFYTNRFSGNLACKCYFIFIFLFFSFPLLSAQPLNQSVPAKIAKIINASLDKQTSEDMSFLIRKHFKTMRLLESNDKWASPELEALSEDLLAYDLNIENMKKFVELVAFYADQNDYLKDFLKKADAADFPLLSKKVSQEGAYVFPDVVAYAIALDRLTRAMRNDWRLLAVCQKIWQKNRINEKLYKYMDLFDYAKLASVEITANFFLKFHKSGNVPVEFMKKILPMNILEAVAVDVTLKNLDNAYTGKILSEYSPGSEKVNASTGEGPSTWSTDRKAILLNMALPRKWADLYATWNMSFVSHYGHFPYVLVKLLIPQVNDYSDNPSEYIYNRALALYTHLNYAYYNRADNAKSSVKLIEWSDKNLTKLWGSSNKKSAERYEEAVAKAKKDSNGKD